MKPSLDTPFPYSLQHSDGELAIAQEGVIIKGDVLHAILHNTSAYLVNHLGGISLDKPRIEEMGGAVDALKGAPARGEATAVVEMGIEVKGRGGEAIEVIWVGREYWRDAGQRLQKPEDLRLTQPFANEVSP
jgi:hypothetical protein